VNESSAPVSSAQDAATGTPDSWEAVASAINQLQVNDKAVLLTVEGDNFSPVLFDFKTVQVYTETSLQALPTSPQNVTLRVESIDPSNPPSPWFDWTAPDAFLWRIGTLAFTDSVAPWLIPGDAYVLNKWPNLSLIDHTVDEIRAISMLANGLLSIDQLARVAQITTVVSGRVISKLSLLGMLKSAPALPDTSIHAPLLAPVAEEPAASAEVISAPVTHLPVKRPAPSVVTAVEPVPPAKELVQPVSVFGPPKANFDDINGALPPLVIPEPVGSVPELPEASETLEAMPELTDVPEVSEEIQALEPLEVEALTEEVSEPEAVESGPVLAPHLYPAFDPSAPPPPIMVREPTVKNPHIGIETSFNSIIKSKAEEEAEDGEPKEKRGGLFGKLRPRKG